MQQDLNGCWFLSKFQCSLYISHGSGLVRTHFYDWNKTHFHPQEVYCSQYFLPLSPSSSTPSQSVIRPDSEDIPGVKGCKNCTTLHDLFLILFCYLEKSPNLLKGWKEGQLGQELFRTSRNLPTFCLCASLLHIPTAREVRLGQRNNHTLNKTQR